MKAARDPVAPFARLPVSAVRDWLPSRVLSFGRAFPRRLTHRLLAIIVALSALHPPTAHAGLTGTTEEIAPGVFLLYSDFGLWKQTDDGNTFLSTSVIELKANQSFGWRLRLRTEKPDVKLRVVLTLPAPPKIWAHLGEIIEKDVSSDGLMKISPDRRTATEETEYPVGDDGWINSSWSFADGDPTGDHVVRIYVKDKLLRIFRFKVVPAKK